MLTEAYMMIYFRDRKARFDIWGEFVQINNSSYMINIFIQNKLSYDQPKG